MEKEFVWLKARQLEVGDRIVIDLGTFEVKKVENRNNPHLVTVDVGKRVFKLAPAYPVQVIYDDTVEFGK